VVGVDAVLVERQQAAHRELRLAAAEHRRGQRERHRPAVAVHAIERLHVLSVARHPQLSCCHGGHRHRAVAIHPAALELRALQLLAGRVDQLLEVEILGDEAGRVRVGEIRREQVLPIEPNVHRLFEDRCGRVEEGHAGERLREPCQFPVPPCVRLLFSRRDALRPDVLPVHSVTPPM
jgi:hypothetical protein